MSDSTMYTPDEYFHYIKSKRQSITDKDLQHIYDNCLELLNKYRITGQVKGARKLLFHLECIERERKIVAAGINMFIYRDDIEEYIDSIAKDVVKIIELENYEREIPDEIVRVIEAHKDKFDHLYVLFTDYTGKVERQIEKERRSADPILFGTLQDDNTQTVVDRFYYLGDWEDEFCDLTLDKMVGEAKDVKKRDITHTISTPEDIEELKKQIIQLEETHNGVTAFKASDSQKEVGLFSKIRTFLSKL